ncbi:Predicted pyrophosphatase or phosphodiesterase, AlkP superfamily [Lachnospiraceae bacterium]|nr:Predicted pyrophosphatase or phosphodiesterase, AlkP superfamily [Lachnospiraceae bacterium]
MDSNIINNIPNLPDYSNCLVNLANSILKKYGATTTANTLPLADEYLNRSYKNVVVLLLDAMGISILEKHLAEDGFFRSHLAGEYNSVYPPTTVAATTSLLSGLYPNEHGWLGWDMYIPKLDKNVTLFTNKEQAHEKEDAVPVRIEVDGTKIWDTDSFEELEQAADYNVGFTLLPYENIVDKINNAGGKAFFSMPFMPPFPQNQTEIFERIENLCKEPGEKFIYAYWHEPDNTMHRTGTTSDSTHAVIKDLEERVEKLASKLEDTLLFITADHGHMDSRNICILDYPEVMECLLRLPSIEPRTINLFVKDEYMDTFPEIFKKNFGEDDFLLLTKEEVLDDKVFGIGENRDDLADMLGDYVAFSISDVSIFVSHYEAQIMPGGHAGLTPEEYIIPLIVVCYP